MHTVPLAAPSFSIDLKTKSEERLRPRQCARTANCFSFSCGEQIQSSNGAGVDLSPHRHKFVNSA